jgi:hypothetical protein
VRHRRPAKQRIWLGPGRYFCGCKQRIAHADAITANAYSDCNGDGNCNGYIDGSCERNAYRDCDCNRNCNSDLHTQTNADSAARANNEASPDASAPAVEAFAGNRRSACHPAGSRSRSE